MTLPTFARSLDLQHAIHEAYPEIPWLEPTRCKHEQIRGECGECARERRTLRLRKKR